MNVQASEVPDSLTKSADYLEGLGGIKVLNSWRWYESAKKWALHFEVDLGTDSLLVPRTTEWYVLATERYPVGRIQVLPAAEKGLEGTFHHQRFNLPNESFPWTWGEICVDVPGHLLGRLVTSPEPMSISDRLRWHVSRAKSWLTAAASGDLVRDGERFELPDFPTNPTSTRRFAYSEGFHSLKQWETIDRKTGHVKLLVFTQDSLQTVIPLSFQWTNGKPLVDVQWGKIAESANTQMGAWVLLPKIPSLAPWQAPSTWGELFEIGQQIGVGLEETLAKTFANLRDRQYHVLLIGFPIPAIVGGSPSRIHWQALQLPQLSTIKGAFRKGFRPTADLAMKKDLETIFAADKKLVWLQSDNWDEIAWGSRGRIDVGRNFRTVIIGLGTLGSAIAEMLVRSGVNHIELIDGDDIEPGNLVRHTLTLMDIGKNKASALADRLNLISPNACVDAIPKHLDPRDESCRSAIEKADLVIDCTASHGVPAELHEFSWNETTTLISLSIGINAEIIYVYTGPGWSFSSKAFGLLIDPLVAEDSVSHPGFELWQEDAGCWHPTFPARSDEIWFASSLAMKEIVDIVGTKPTRAELRVIRYDGQLNREVLRVNEG